MVIHYLILNQQLLDYNFTRDKFGALQLNKIRGYSFNNNKKYPKTANYGQNRKKI